MSAPNNFKSLFYPKSIAVLGASRDPQKVGGAILQNLLSGEFKNKTFAVNPSAQSAQGIKSFSSVQEIPVDVDLAILAVPAQFVRDALTQCGEKSVKAAIIISSGFKESGEEGAQKEEEIIKIARKYKIAVLGPNCLGIINNLNGLNGSFASANPLAGNIALISQSGAIISSLIDWGNTHNLGFSYIASLGNKAVLDECNFLKFLENDQKTKAIALYLENISNPKKFIEISRKISVKKPIVVFKSGFSQAGQDISESHTGALATEDRVIDAILDKAGAIRANDLEEFLETARILSLFKKPSDKVFIITNAGGVAVSAADEISRSKNLRFAEISSSSARDFKKVLPQFISVKNPMDIGGDAQSERFEKVLEIAQKDKVLSNSVIFLAVTPQKMTDINGISSVIEKFKDKLNLAPIFIGGANFEKVREDLQNKNFPVFNFLFDAVKALDLASRGYRNSEFLDEEKGADEILKLNRNDEKKIQQILAHSEGGWISMDKSFDILQTLKLPIADFFVADNLDQLENAAKKLGFPLVMKTARGDIIHKAKANQIVCSICDRKAMAKGFMQIKKPVIIQKQENANLELIVGIKNDPNAGRLLMFGIGGTLANELKQVKFYLLPISEREAGRAVDFSLGRLNLAPAIKKSLVEILLGAQKLALNFEEISEIDFNPVLVDTFRKKVFCVDVKIKI
ncbi:MAG: acetate--CoA ligase family protein [bacterium]